MLKTIEKKVATMAAEMKANDGIIPESWKPEIEIIKAVLEVIRPFFGDTGKAEIDAILLAISALESA